MSKAQQWEKSTEPRKNKPELEPETPPRDDGNGWQRWKIYVLETIDKIESKVDQIEDRRSNCQLWCTQEITKLKVKSSIWGAISGFIVSLILTLVLSLSAGYVTKNVDIVQDQKSVPAQVEQKKNSDHQRE